MKQEIIVRLKGSFYSFNTHCETLKDAMQTYPQLAKRSWIAEWWKETPKAETANQLTDKYQMEYFETL